MAWEDATHAPALLKIPAQAQKLRHRGEECREECRTLARLMDTKENTARYLRMAAEQEEQLARDVVKFKLKR
jgi:hypothetical protein